MESRRIQLTGGSSFIVTLPKHWIESASLKKNDVVFIEETDDGSLSIKASNKDIPCGPTPQPIVLCEGDDASFLLRKLIGSYVTGHDEIELMSETPFSREELDTVSEFVKTSIGMEIVEETDRRIRIKDVMQRDKIDPMASLERMKSIAKRIMIDTADAMKVGECLANVEERDMEIDRIDHLITRQCSVCRCSVPFDGLSFNDMLCVMQASMTIERICDMIVQINRSISLMDDTIAIRSLSVIVTKVDIPDFLDKTVTAFIERDAQSANPLISDCRNAMNTITDIHEICELMDSSSDIHARIMAEGFLSVFRGIVHICELTLDLTMA